MTLGIIAGGIIIFISFLKLYGYIGFENLLFSCILRGTLGFFLFFFAGYLLEKGLFQVTEPDIKEAKEKNKAYILDYRIPPISPKE